MILITRKILASQVAKRWRERYGEKRWVDDAEKHRILKSLEELGDSPNPDDIDKVIGNKSWTRTECHECGLENIDVVQVGQQPDYESHTANICKNCLKLAVKV